MRLRAGKPTAALLAALAVASGLLVGGAARADDGALATLVRAKDHDGAVALLGKGADGKSREVDGTTALMWACYNGDAELVERLLKAGAEVSVVNDYGASALQVAAVVADPRIIKDLLKAGANPDSPSPEGQTALMVVARSGNVESAKLLLDAGATVDAREQWGNQTALMWAAAEAHPEMIKLLIAHHADVNAHGAIRDWQRRVTAEGRPKNENHGGFTPLIYAARIGCIECAQALLKGHADINLPDPDGETALLLSIINMHFNFASYLIAAGADVNRWDFYGQTPLYAAIDMATLPTGGRPDLPSADKTQPLQVAEQLLKAGANVNAQLKLRPPYRNGVFDRGGDQVLSTGATALLAAAKSGNNDAIRLLLKYHPMVDLPNAEGVTPLMAAAGMGHSFNPTRGRYKTDAEALEGVKLLQAAGGKIDGSARDGLTALHAAAAHGWDGTVKLLVADGAPLQPTDRLGLRPIDYAAGRQPRAFLEPEHVPNDATVKLLTDDIVAATGQKPLVFAGNLNRATQGTGGAGGTSLRPGGAEAGGARGGAAGAPKGGAAGAAPAGAAGAPGAPPAAAAPAPAATPAPPAAAVPGAPAATQTAQNHAQ
ncbi:MAG TPA: ankyrin repeat domain-containing protein [Steroidobacteraceae bacterium]|jgi:ankyrin repeat protein|nr:ankyrin repeat domain-containing protein [Steroidobacteraceae bacterium]